MNFVAQWAENQMLSADFIELVTKAVRMKAFSCATPTKSEYSGLFGGINSHL